MSLRLLSSEERKTIMYGAKRALTTDWSLYDDAPECQLTCICGGVWRSHYKAITNCIGLIWLSKKPCARCGRHDTVHSAIVAKSGIA